jgi:hypothetical protein
MKILPPSALSNVTRPDPKPVPSVYFVTVNGERGKIWQNAVGTRTFPVIHKDPVPASVLGNTVMAYFLDLSRVEARLRDRIEHFLCERYGLPLDQVRYQIKEGGVPILARNVTTPEGWNYGDTDY